MAETYSGQMLQHLREERDGLNARISLAEELQRMGPELTAGAKTTRVQQIKANAHACAVCGAYKGHDEPAAEASDG